MPIIGDFQVIRAQDGIITLAMSPPIAIGGWEIEFVMAKRFGSTEPTVTKSVSSGLNNTSGINITNSGTGVMDITLSAVNTSGLEYGNRAFWVNRLGSGVATKISEGYVLVNP